MEFFVALVLFFILFALASSILALGMALGYMVIITGVFPWWFLVAVGVAVIWHLGAESRGRG